MYEVDVVIPCRNTGGTIEDIVDRLMSHPCVGQINVVVDQDTTDATQKAAGAADRVLIGGPGKGQCVMVGLQYVTTPWVLFMDSDLLNLDFSHISLLLADAIEGSQERMTIGVPDVPDNYPTERLWAWSWVSGERCLPTKVVRPLELHGYLMETQINRAAKHARLPLNFEWLTGLVSPYVMSEQRLREMERDAAWGRAHGLL